MSAHISFLRAKDFWRHCTDRHAGTGSFDERAGRQCCGARCSKHDRMMHNVTSRSET